MVCESFACCRRQVGRRWLGPGRWWGRRWWWWWRRGAPSRRQRAHSGGNEECRASPAPQLWKLWLRLGASREDHSCVCSAHWHGLDVFRTEGCLQISSITGVSAALKVANSCGGKALWKDAFCRHDCNMYQYRRVVPGHPELSMSSRDIAK